MQGYFDVLDIIIIIYKRLHYARDIRLYQAKEKGRNRVVGYNEGSQE